MIKVKKGKRYFSLIGDEGRILHIHYTGSTVGEVHFDKPFWDKTTNSNFLYKLLSKSYNVKNLKGDVRIIRTK